MHTLKYLILNLLFVKTYGLVPKFQSDISVAKAPVQP